MAETTPVAFKGCINCGTLIKPTSKYCAYCGIVQQVTMSQANIQNTTSAQVVCPGCGETIDRDDARYCPVCGCELVHEKVLPAEIPKIKVSPPVEVPAQASTQMAPPKVAVVTMPAAQPVDLPPNYVLNSKGKKIHRITAGVLGILLGSVGAHWFYIGRPELGVLSALTCWTGIPAIVGFIHGIIYLTSTDANFKAKYVP
ncbi:MAG: NINE protein [Candidatus Sigynarchaeota archaeon]